MWIIRPESPTDVTQVRSVVTDAFPTPDEADLVDALREDPAWIPDFSLVAVAEPESPGGSDGHPSETVLGHVLLTRCHIGEVPALALAPVAVAQAEQRRGAGSALVRAALEAARAAGGNAVVVVGHPEYYPRFGFHRASADGITVPCDAPDEAVMVTGLNPAESLPPGQVRYAAAFGL